MERSLALIAASWTLEWLSVLSSGYSMDSELNVKTEDELRSEKQEEWEFEVECVLHEEGMGEVYVAKCPIDCYKFNWLIGKTATFTFSEVEKKKKMVVNAMKYDPSTTYLRPGFTAKGSWIRILVHSMNY